MSTVAGSFRKTGNVNRKTWMSFSNLKLEAAVFLLIALTFAAVLGQEGITRQETDLAARSGLYYPFTYGDQDEGGRSTISHAPSKPLKWSCDLRPGAQYAYCGYGLQLDASGQNTGVDFSKYSDIKVKVTYKGVGDHMRLLVQSAVPASLSARVNGATTIPMVTEFVVAQGENTIHIRQDQFAVEEWWLASHKLARDEVPVNFERVVSVAFSSGSTTPYGQFNVSVSSFSFKGTSVSSAHWYLIILGVWLVLTGGFLVFRFLGMRRAYEARQRWQAEESEALSKARAAAEASSAAKSQFLANMSHELRTPLNAILGYTQLLQNDTLTTSQIAAINTIHHSGEHLLAMITDILDLSKVEAGRLELIAARFDLHACVVNVSQMIRLRAEEKGLRFVTTIGHDVPRYIETDQKRIRQVLINLLGNAVKFTSEGEISVSVSTVWTHAHQTRLRFDITDTGVGIRDDQLAQIFRPFEQAGNAIDRSCGTGLGLSITHQIVQMMGGDVTVESTLGYGSRFRVEATFDLAADDTISLGFDGAEPSPHSGDLPPTETAPTLLAPEGAQMARLLVLARAGNLRAIRKEIPSIVALGEPYHPFAARLDSLAASYQSPAVLRLIEQYAQERAAA
ncbi:hypothetical protein GCM10011273_34710 [Asticcacaulis endophyticus]|uniref:Sensory/regulatory protein RpfC n=2 Tax=Asticcacaulis endophyticus TaxID=1395890 RepID=A0A918QHM3_9CAUL|nr:hypothetical protein GCM10011273_34710 [Asticcacaulis endophyticus]